MPPDFPWIRFVEQLPDGTVVRAGSALSYYDPIYREDVDAVYIERRKVDGSFDPRFAGKGWSLTTGCCTPEDYSEGFSDFRVNADGDIVYVAWAGSYGRAEVLGPDGAKKAAKYRDNTESFELSIPPHDDLDVLSKGRLLTGKEGEVSRYVTFNEPDATFGPGGSRSTNFGAEVGGKPTIGRSELLVEKGEAFVLASTALKGTAKTGGAYYLVLARYRADGTLDPAFGGGDGMASFFISKAPARDADRATYPAFHFTRTADGKVLASGIDPASGEKLSVRFHANGKLDKGYGTQGSLRVGGRRAFHGTPVLVQEHRVEAEDFDYGGERVAYHDADARNRNGVYRREGPDVGFGGTDLVVGHTKAGEWLSYTVQVETTGVYALSLAAANPAAGGRVRLEVDGKDATGPIEVPKTGGFGQFTRFSGGEVALTAGVHVLRLKMDRAAANGAVGNFDFMELWLERATPAQRPFKGTAPDPGQVVQFEDFDKGGAGVAYQDSDPENRGGAYRDTPVDIKALGNGRYAVGWTSPGEWLEYTVNGHGFFAIEVRMASLTGGGKVRLESHLSSVELEVPKTGSSGNYVTVSSDPVFLPGHPFTLRFSVESGVKGAVGNFDAFRLVYLGSDRSEFQTPYGDRPFRTGETIQYEDFDLSSEHDGASADVSTRGGNSEYRWWEGVGISDRGTGHVLDVVEPTEWVEYTIDVLNAGTYEFLGSVSNTAAGASFHLELDGKRITTGIAVPDTGSLETFTTLRRGGVVLPVGRHVLRIVFDTAASDGSGGNFDSFRFRPQQ